MLRPKSQKPAAEAGLVELLLECHERIRRFCALARAAGEPGDAPVEQVSEACASVERYFGEALPLHVQDEEESILPRLSGHSPEVDRALATMQTQHAEHEPQLHAMSRACAALRQNPTDVSRRATLATAAEQLEISLEAHLRLEESVVFPAIRSALSDAVQADIVKELRARRVR
jgi:iron-sulfur cluster repair protein YtfE (RIC family)